MLHAGFSGGEGGGQVHVAVILWRWVTVVLSVRAECASGSVFDKAGFFRFAAGVRQAPRSFLSVAAISRGPYLISMTAGRTESRCVLSVLLAKR